MAELICRAHMHPLPCPGSNYRTTDNQRFVEIMDEYRAENTPRPASPICAGPAGPRDDHHLGRRGERGQVQRRDAVPAAAGLRGARGRAVAGGPHRKLWLSRPARRNPGQFGDLTRTRTGADSRQRRKLRSRTAVRASVCGYVAGENSWLMSY